MDKQEIIEGNKLIAEFMGLKEKLDFQEPKTDEGGYFPVNQEGQYDLSEYFIPYSHLDYHLSFDSVAPVMNKICSLGYTVQWTITDGSTCRIWAHRKEVKPCGVIITDRPFTAVVEFVKFYNSQKQ